VCDDDILKELQAALPFEADPVLLEEIVTQSCSIPFVGAGEKFFKPGDPAKGFYWLLSGAARMVIPEDAPLELPRGFMLGLDSFLLRRPHPFAIETAAEGAHTLFVNRVSYAHFSEHKSFHRLINKQILYHLDAYRRRLAAPQAAGFSDPGPDPYRLR
jgi:CRP-like cAMP-binding protein